MRVESVEVAETGRGTRLSADVLWERSARPIEKIYYEYREVDEPSVTTPGDALTAAVFMVAMAYGEDIVVDAPVSPRLVENTGEIARVWSAWRPNWRRPSVAAGTVNRAPLAPTQVAACFSGGLDSFYTALRPRDDPITTLISMHGYEVQDQLVPQLDEAMANLGRAAARLGKRHIVVETNVFRWCLRYLPWSVETGTVHHGACLASMALGLGAILRKCYIASTHSRWQSPWGSHERTDRFWSTETLEIVHDAPYTRRIEKYGIVAQSDVALDALQVCHGGRSTYANCRRCDKCIITAYMLHLAGTLDRCSTLGPVSPDLVRRTAVGYWHHADWADLLAQTDDPEYRKAIAAALRRARVRKLARPVKRVLRRFELSTQMVT